MKKYEYMMVKLDYKVALFQTRLNEYGQEGWEYVRSFSESSHGEVHLLKRELPQDWAKESLDKVEEITENQREEKCGRCESGICSTHPPISMKDGVPTHTCDQSLLTHPPQCKQCYDEKHHIGEEGNLSKNSNSSKEPDYQALREESLKGGFVREIKPLNEKDKVVFAVI